MADEFDAGDPLTSFGPTWTRILVDPRGFFETLPLEGGLRTPAIFAAICLAIGAFFFLFAAGLKGALGFFILGLLRLFVGAAILALIAERVFDGRGDYEATFRVLAYTSAITVFVAIPVIKVFAAIYGAYLVAIGLEKAQRFDSPRAVLTMIVTMAVSVAMISALGLWPLARAVNPLLR